MRRAAGLIALAFVAAHAAVFLAGRTLLPIAPSMTTVPGAPYGYSGPVPDATTSVDPAGAVNVSYSNDRFTAEALSRGRMPFWNSRQGFGSPFLSSGHPAVLYPLTPLLTIVPPDEYDFLYLFNWYLAALFTYLFLRTIDVGDGGAIIGGVAVAASGFFQYYIAFREASTTAAWFPALLYAVERTLREPDWRWRHVAITVACYGTVTAGQPESTALALTAVTLYGLVSVAASPRRAAALRAFLPGAVCGALLTAPHWWNFSDYAFTAFSGHDPGSTGTQASLGWRTAAAYVTPQLYGRLHTLPPQMIPPGWSWDLSPGWIPAAVSLGALFGMWRAAASRSRPLILLIAIAVLVAGRVWGLPPFTLISRLPLFDRIVYPRYGAFVLAFVAAILAGAGWEFALSKTPRQWLRVGAAWIAVAAVLYLLTGIWRQPVFAGDPSPRVQRARVDVDGGGAGGALVAAPARRDRRDGDPHRRWRGDDSAVRGLRAGVRARDLRGADRLLSRRLAAADAVHQRRPPSSGSRGTHPRGVHLRGSRAGARALRFTRVAAAL